MRARKQGRSHLSAWDDLSLNRVFLAIACAILLVTGTFHGDRLSSPMRFRLWSDLRGTIRWGSRPACWSSRYFGLAMQYFFLRFEIAGRCTSGCFCFWPGCFRWSPGRSSMASWFGNDDDLGQIDLQPEPDGGDRDQCGGKR